MYLLSTHRISVFKEQEHAQHHEQPVQKALVCPPRIHLIVVQEQFGGKNVLFSCILTQSEEKSNWNVDININTGNYYRSLLIFRLYFSTSVPQIETGLPPQGTVDLRSAYEVRHEHCY